MSEKILVVDDEVAMRFALVQSLQKEGYKVQSASQGEEGLEVALTNEFDLILLDVMMPKIDGFTVCRELRSRGCKTPVLFLTARGQVTDKVTGLDSGGDDYLVKPFSIEELLARVRALTRREARKSINPKVQLGTAFIDLDLQTCEVDGQKFDLSEKEVGIIRLLVTQNGAVVSRDRFLNEVWSYHANPTLRTVDNYVAKLRKKLGVNGTFIKSIHGQGYRIEEGPLG